MLLMIHGFVILIVSKYRSGRRHESTSYVSWNSRGEKQVVLPIPVVSLYVGFFLYFKRSYFVAFEV